MDIKEIRKSLAQLERDTMKLVRTFEDSTGCFISGISIDKAENLRGDKPTAWVRINADVKPDRS